MKVSDVIKHIEDIHGCIDKLERLRLYNDDMTQEEIDDAAFEAMKYLDYYINLLKNKEVI